MAWTQEQWNNAKLIYQVGVQMGMSARDIQIALITALTESGMRNLNYGDRDSLGMFQQRPSQGWGTPQQILDPVYATRKFFEALRGLGDKRYRMDMGAAAQAVQRSAFPDRYAKFLPEVRKNWPRVQTSSGHQPATVDGGPVPEDWEPEPLVYRPPEIEPPVNRDYLGAAYQQTAESNLPDAVKAPDMSMAGSQQNALGALVSHAEPDPAELIIGPHTENVLREIREETGGFEVGVDGWRKAVVQYAMKALGTPYRFGGNDLFNAIDCSGLVQQVFAKFGFNLPRVSYQQANFGKRVSLDKLRPGDLVAWDNSPRNPGADHIAIYIGNGEIIEAPRPGLAVRVRSLGKNEGAWGVALDF